PDVAVVSGDRICNRARHAPERCLVQHQVHRAACAATSIERADIALHETEVFPLAGAESLFHLLQVVSVARGKIVQPYHPLIQLEQGFQQMRADESGRARNQPGARCGADALLHLFVARHPWIVGFHYVALARPPWSGWTVAALRSRSSSPSNPSKRSSTLEVECVLLKYSRQRTEARLQCPSSVNNRSISAAASSTRSTILKSRDRKSTRLNSSHVAISYAVFCLKKKKEEQTCLYRLFARVAEGAGYSHR